MSYIGEARGFRKSAEVIAKRLASTEALTGEERTKLEKELDWYQEEWKMCWAAARQEARIEEYCDNHPEELEDEDELQEDDDEC